MTPSIPSAGSSSPPTPHSTLQLRHGKADGNLVTRNLGFRQGDVGEFTLHEPDRLEVIGGITVPERLMGRFSCDTTNEGQMLYSTTPTEVLRLIYKRGSLSLDETWRASYAVEGEHQSDAWDTTIGDGSIWLMDMGRPGGWIGPPGQASQRAFRFPIDDPGARDVIDELGEPFGFNPGPPLFDPTRRILVHYDARNGGIVAHRAARGRRPELLWRNDARNFLQMMVWADTGELVVEDADRPPGDYSALVFLDIETGEELGRAPTGGRSMGMFPCPGFGRDVYVASGAGTVTRVAVA